MSVKLWMGYVADLIVFSYFLVAVFVWDLVAYVVSASWQAGGAERMEWSYSELFVVYLGDDPWLYMSMSWKWVGIVVFC